LPQRDLPGSNQMMKTRFDWRSLLAVMLLWAFFAQAVTSMAVQSATVDEQAHFMRGYLYLKLGTPVFRIGHPLLADTLAAVPLRLLTSLDIPADEDAFQSNDWGNYSDAFVWRPGVNVDMVFFLSRLTVVALGMLFAALVWRWAGRLWGNNAGLVALALFVFDPTIVAHSQLVTHDVPVSVFYFAAAYGLWRYLETCRTRHLILTGITFGLAQASKFSALLLAPLFVVMVAVWPFLHGTPMLGRCAAQNDPLRSGQVGKARWWKERALGLLAIFALGGLTVWALYRFEIRPIAGVPLPVPAAGYFEDMLWEVRYFAHDRYFFLCGQYSASGWWYYFPLAFAIKTPLPAMLLIGAAFAGLGRPESKSRLTALLLPALAYLGSTLISPLYIGYRYFIPALPFLYVLAGRLAVLMQHRWRWALAGVLIWSGVIAARIHPDGIAYFNELIGGPDNGWRCLVDSNIDWGQSLPALRDLIQREQLGRIKLSYFGSAHPSFYGIDYEPLPTADLTPERGHPALTTFYPHDPAPGVYAISATNLQGIAMQPEQWDTFAYFRARRPFARAGYSILLYRVEPTGATADVVLSNLSIDQLSQSSFDALGTNDVRTRWANANTSLIIPDQPAWYIAGDDTLKGWGWTTTRPCTTTLGQPCRLYPPDAAAQAQAIERIERLGVTSKAWSGTDQSPLALPLDLDHQLEFRGYELNSARPGDLSLLTAWRVTAQPAGPRAIFVHLVDDTGQIVAQWDGLDVPVEGWRAGDYIIQMVTLPLRHNVSGHYRLQVGVYNPATMERLKVMADGNPIADRILLNTTTSK
jgi:hypothetical protein